VGVNLARMLSCFSKEGEDFVADYPLRGIDLAALQELFAVPVENPMYDVWPVGPREAARLQPFVGTTIDLDRYDYFVECHSLPEAVGVAGRDDSDRETSP